ncbi:MAG TPA: DUF4194 domain-containing protein [Trueperaceae bacterium]
MLEPVLGTDQSSPTQPALSRVVPTLLKGVIYREEDADAWAQLVALQGAVSDYVRVLGLELYLDEAEGFAFLRSLPEDEEAESRAPRLVARRQLTFPVSLLLALLRKKLAEFDAEGSQARLVLTLDELAETLRLFLPDGSNEARLVDRVETHLNKVAELGFVRKLRRAPGAGPQAYEVRRIIKAFVDAQWLGELDQKLAEYRQHLGQEPRDQDDD